MRRLDERISGRIARVREIRRERRDGHSFVVYELSDSKRKPEGKPPRVHADWRHAV
jgi:hypothetical protein